jgi:hypothetical protein
MPASHCAGFRALCQRLLIAFTGADTRFIFAYFHFRHHFSSSPLFLPSSLSLLILFSFIFRLRLLSSFSLLSISLQIFSFSLLLFFASFITFDISLHITSMRADIASGFFDIVSS